MIQPNTIILPSMAVEWLATSIAYLFPNESNYWASVSLDQADFHLVQSDRSEMNNHKVGLS